MSKFKVGQELELVVGRFQHAKGSTIIVGEVDAMGVYFEDGGYTTDDKLKLAGNTDTKWTFNVNAEYQIDFDSISNDLTKERQIAIVTTSKGETYGVVSEALLGKYEHSESFWIREAKLHQICSAESKAQKGMVYFIREGQTPEFFKFWKEVKTCPLGSGYRGKREVTVNLIKI